jgi:hypothetical protein
MELAEKAKFMDFDGVSASSITSAFNSFIINNLKIKYEITKSLEDFSSKHLIGSHLPACDAGILAGCTVLAPAFRIID